MKKYISVLLIITFILTLSACTFVRKPLDDYSSFTSHLSKTEKSILAKDWDSAMENLENSEKAWKKIKPLLQIDIDHDYVNDIENCFTQLKAYIKTEDESNSLATINLIQSLWRNIGEM